MVLGVLAVVGILGAIVGAIVLAMRGGRGGLEWAPRNLVRVYLYIASMAGIIVLVVGLSGVLTAGFAAAFGNAFVYGDSSAISPIPACGPVTDPNVKCVPGATQDIAAQQRREQDRRRGDDLIRGITFTAFGALVPQGTSLLTADRYRVQHLDFVPTVWSMGLGRVGVVLYAASVIAVIVWLVELVGRESEDEASTMPDAPARVSA